MEITFAGGCFWCIAMPFYDLDGVLEVVSGYMGGTLVNPTYEDVKSNKYHHLEVIKVVYNKPCDVYTLIDTYFSNIDPFDDGGQFIDRGENYTLCVFTNNEDEINYVNKKIQNLEDTYKKKVFVKIRPLMPFYKAEEYHQDYGLKNPDKIKEEFILSGRKINERTK